MLVEFRVGNYRSFRAPQTISMVASGDRTHPANLIPRGKYDLLKSVAVYGANASGKSNLLRAMMDMIRLIDTSATSMNVGDEIDVIPFRLDRRSRSEPSLFELTFVIGSVQYKYGFSATRQRVHDEWLIAYPKGRAQHWFERRYDPHSQQSQWTFRGGLKSSADLLGERTRDNGLALSRGAELNVAVLTPVFRALTERIRAFSPAETASHWFLSDTVEQVKEDEAMRGRALQLVRDADLAIRDLRVTDQDAPRVPLEQLLADVLGGRLSPLEATASFGVKTVHSTADAGEEEVFDLSWESDGTVRFLAMTGLWLHAIAQGWLVVADELDASMHPALTRSLIQLFQSPDANQSGAQLIFTTHDTSLMDQTLFRRDQIWLVEKDANQASRLSSLYDFDEKPRVGEALEKRYLAGRYGGVPNLGPAFEDIGTD
jgi:AAA15 family ATPase/GTPase